MWDLHFPLVDITQSIVWFMKILEYLCSILIMLYTCVVY